MSSVFLLVLTYLLLHLNSISIYLFYFKGEAGQKIMKPEVVLRIAIGGIMLVFGLNQMLDPNYWVGYVPTFVRHFLPMPVTTFMHIHALGNITLGILLLLGIWKKIITWLTLVWWLTIVPAAFLKQWDIGMRDLVISLTLVSYIWLIYQTADR